LRIDILTLFPEMFPGPFSASIIKRATDGGLVSLNIYNIRDYTHDKHHTVDDYAYGGGAGMILKPEPVFAAVESIKEEDDCPVILLTPQGRPFSQRVAQELSGHGRLILICGRYEGVDERVCEHLVTDEISIGDYVLSGGELAAMVIVDAVTRLLPGVLGDPAATFHDSHASGLLEHPHYTRPAAFRGWTVPEILLSGHHANLSRWRRNASLRRTWERRPELLEKASLSEVDRAYIETLEKESL
jgi:tRNA (guanine37-N1)-methyltransferase